MTHHECDACGKTLHHGDMFTAAVKRVGCASGRTYELCEKCAEEIKAAMAACVNTKRR